MYILLLEDDLVLYAWIDDVYENKLTIFEGAELAWISCIRNDTDKEKANWQDICINQKRNGINFPVG